MKRVSTALIVIGLLMLLNALASDVAVDGLGRSRISNVGLMHDRLINTILSGFVILCGLLLKIFGGNLNANGEGYLQAIDRLPKGEYVARWVTTILASACFWILLVMYVWPTTMVGVLMLAAVGWYTFQPKPTYVLIKQVSLIVAVLAACLLAFHLIAITKQWINVLTLGLFSDGVSLTGSSNAIVLLGSLVLAPLVVASAGWIFAKRKVRRA